MASLLRASVAKAGYARNPHQIYDNMDTDPVIKALPGTGKPAARVELLNGVAAHRDDQARMRVEAVLFCRAHQQEGPTFPTATNPTFGRVNGFRALVNAVAHPNSGLSLARAEALLRDVIHDAPLTMRFARQRAALAGKTLGRNQMWCYPVGDLGNPFAEIGGNRSATVNVLGLGWYAYNAPDDELVRWAHTLPETIAAHLPTAWDAGESVYWRPGGRTYRLDDDAYGVSEVVHNPITGDCLTVAIDPIP